MRRNSLLALGVLCVMAGCGSDDPPETPAACLQPDAGYLEALKSAPGEVRLDGTTPISGCLVEDQEAGQLGQVGQSLVGAATKLNAELRRGDTDATLQLGYLLGAVQEAAAKTGGIHEDLTIRLDTAANFTPSGKPFSAAVERVLNQGYAAGQQSG